MIMRSFTRSFAVLLLLTGSLAAYAAKPTSVKYVEDIVMPDDTIYQHYVVKCSNGNEVDVSAFDDKKKWCMGKGTQEECQKKQIKIAKLACR